MFQAISSLKLMFLEHSTLEHRQPSENNALEEPVAVNLPQ